MLGGPRVRDDRLHVTPAVHFLMSGIEKDYRCRKEAGRVGPSAGVDHRVSAPLVKQDADDHDAPPDLLAPNAMTSLSGVGKGGGPV